MIKTKLFHSPYILIALTLFLSACAPNNPTIDAGLKTSTPVLPTATIEPSATITPLPTSTSQPTPTITLTPPATLEPEQAKETIQRLLQEPIDCAAPCFWGITPEKTTLSEAKNIFTRLGFQMTSKTYQNKYLHGVAYDFDDGLSIIITLTVQGRIVMDSRVDIKPEIKKLGATREWLAYSPETLIKRYGVPSRIDFFVDRGPNPSYQMGMYFDAVNLFILYNSYDLGLNLQACPISGQIDSIYLSMGKNPQYLPSDWVPLEKATSMTIGEFSKLMVENPEKACFNLKAEVFP